MNAIWQAIDRWLRGNRFLTGLMKGAGIDPRKYWLLIDLFGNLSERRELFSQLSRNGVELKKVSWVFYIMSALLAIGCVAGGIRLSLYFAIFMGLSGFLMFLTLLSETNNSLINPIEGMVLAHQPINGATYTSAKLTHLLLIVGRLTPAFNLIPAFAALLLPQCPWYYPVLQLAAGFALGLVLALSCCALFGWLIRFVPPARLKSVGLAAELISWVFYASMQFLGQLRNVHVPLPHFQPLGMGARWTLAGAAIAASLAAMTLGIRALSGDYLARVSAIAHGGSGRKIKLRHSRLGGVAASLFGGPSARGGFEFLSRMMLRDWQFRRALAGMVPLAVMVTIAIWQGVRISPFSGKFTMSHMFPHVFGVAFYMICSVIVYGTDHQGSWLFLLAPAGAIRGFARGVYARLAALVLAPHVVLFALLAWFWGIRDAGLFIAYSAAVATLYLGLELRLIEGMPFSRQPEGANSMSAIPILTIGALAIGIAVALQHFLIFRSPLAVLMVTLVLGVVSWFVTRSSLDAFEVTIRFRLGLLSSESKGIYTEVNG